jgi:hypothetical protein
LFVHVTVPTTAAPRWIACVAERSPSNVSCAVIKGFFTTKDKSDIARGAAIASSAPGFLLPAAKCATLVSPSSPENVPVKTTFRVPPGSISPKAHADSPAGSGTEESNENPGGYVATSIISFSTSGAFERTLTVKVTFCPDTASVNASMEIEAGDSLMRVP